MSDVDSSPTSQTAPAQAAEAPAGGKLEVVIYQAAGDEMFKGHRPDGTGWDWSWANWQREWMDNTPVKFAYRCLPLTIANQTGWWIYNPVGFTATWNGQPLPGNVHFLFDSDPGTWGTWINDQFGRGIITWNVPFLFRTRPIGTRLLVSGPANYFKHGVQAMTAIVESDWIYMSFTMNWKITSSRLSIRFDQGEPLLQVMPISGNLFTDLEEANVTYMKLEKDPEMFLAYKSWNDARLKLISDKRSAIAKGDLWQKDYFVGRDILGRPTVSGHKTKLTPPEIDFQSPKP
ncbi:MAG TPA: DUF6065 family protein [Tepidisphaeraceae bacterium]|jgi:hypothetical protein|nr:DUF6065 family protein [Tepidisphaeraceae bacterium]